MAALARHRAINLGFVPTSVIVHPSDDVDPRARGTPALPAFFYLALSVVVLFGWRALSWLSDDAFIYFRYASNSLLGHGYVWNAPPFRPVEGYTSLLWIVLIDLVWR